MRNYRISNSDSDTHVVFDAFCESEEQKLNYNKFIGAVLGQMSQRRVKVC